MTAADAKTFNALVAAWIATAGGRQVSAEQKRIAVNTGYTSCGAFSLWHRRYELAAPLGPVSLSVFGMDVYASHRRFRGQTRWLFRGLSAEAAYARFLERMRVYLEPTGELQ